MRTRGAHGELDAFAAVGGQQPGLVAHDLEPPCCSAASTNERSNTMCAAIGVSTRHVDVGRHDRAAGGERVRRGTGRRRHDHAVGGERRRRTRRRPRPRSRTSRCRARFSTMISFSPHCGANDGAADGLGGEPPAAPRSRAVPASALADQVEGVRRARPLSGTPACPTFTPSTGHTERRGRVRAAQERAVAADRDHQVEAVGPVLRGSPHRGGDRLTPSPLQARRAGAPWSPRAVSRPGCAMNPTLIGPAPPLPRSRAGPDPRTGDRPAPPGQQELYVARRAPQRRRDDGLRSDAGEPNASAASARTRAARRRGRATTPPRRTSAGPGLELRLRPGRGTPRRGRRRGRAREHAGARRWTKRSATTNREHEQRTQAEVADVRAFHDRDPGVVPNSQASWP